MASSEEERSGGLPPGFRGRVKMYSMLIGSVRAGAAGALAIALCSTANSCSGCLSINTMVPFVVSDLGLPRSVTPSLLAAFHPGYILTQIPSSFLVKSRGPKFVCSFQLLGSAGMMMLVPAASNLRGSSALKVGVMSVLMFVMGMFQGPMSPVGSQLNRNWMPRGGGPGGVERAWAQRFVSLSHNVCPLLAALFTPRIAERYGWRAVCYIFSGVGGAFLVLWRLLASNSPATVATSTPDAIPPNPKRKAKTKSETNATGTDWRILRTKPALALGLFHLASDVGDFTRHQLAPTVFLEKYKCTPVQMGSYLALGNAANIPAGFIWATLESVLVSRNVDTLRIRRIFEAIGSSAEAVLFVVYAFAPNPIIATLAYGGITAFDATHTSGAWSNYLEVGGDDTAMLNACWNTISSSTAIVIPYLGFWLERVTGTWATMTMIAVGFKVASGCLFCAWSSTETARSILDKEDAAKEQVRSS